MLDIFEKPWTLVGVAILVLFGMLTFRSIFPEKRRRWQLLLPLFLAVSAFGLDFAVKTDLEKVKAVIKTGIKAVEQENCNAIETIIADNYSDSYHNTKASLIIHCRNELARSPVEKITKTDLQIEMSPSQVRQNCRITLTALVKFDKNSFVAQNYKPYVFIKVNLFLQKQPDKRWVIYSVELLELDKQPVNWRQII